MTRRVRGLWLAACVLAGSATLAEAPLNSLRPQGRAGVDGAGAAAVATSGAAAAQTQSLRPQSRQERRAARKAEKEARRDARKAEKEARKSSGKSKRELQKGAVCGDITLQGEAIGNVPGKGACGVPNAVRLRSVSGIKLSQGAVINCDTALALKTWVDKGLVPAFKPRGRVAEIRVAAHYACRTRNNRAGAKLSEHAKGNAIDISAITLTDGQVYTVQDSWWRGRGKTPMRKAYAKACGPFGTTLGPNSDRYHQDHFHFDVARYRSGPYCK